MRMSLPANDLTSRGVERSPKETGHSGSVPSPITTFHKTYWFSGTLQYHGLGKESATMLQCELLLGTADAMEDQFAAGTEGGLCVIRAHLRTAGAASKKG